MKFRRKYQKLRDSARDEDCTLQIYPYCSFETKETVLCHMPSEDKGTGIKSPDWWGAYGCERCHAIIDGRWIPSANDIHHEDVIEAYLRGLYKTQKRMIEKGLIKIV